jgi:hypothetical protein
MKLVVGPMHYMDRVENYEFLKAPLLMEVKAPRKPPNTNRTPKISLTLGRY